jgi:hypothetical protein
LDAVFTQIHRGGRDVPIGDLRDLQAHLAQESIKDEFGKTGRDAIADLVGIGPRKSDEIPEVGEAETGGKGDGDLHLRHPCDGREVLFGIVTQIFVHIGLHHIGAAGPEEEGMIVLRAHHRADGDETIATGLSFDDHRLAPDGLQLFGEQARGDIGAGARTKRQDEAHRARRPGLGHAHDRDGGLHDQSDHRSHDETAQLARHDSPL